MKGVLKVLPVALLFAGCCSRQPATTTPTASGDPAASADPAARQAAIDEVTQIATDHCADGVHGSLEHVATDGALLIVGTAGEVIEGRPTLEEVNASYGTRNVTVHHDCTEAQRYVYASQAGDVVWVEEAIRTHASWPGFTTDFPSQRTMIFERGPAGWQLRFYELAARIPDDQLDDAYAQPPETPAQAAPPAATPQ
jgi:hypothetical protein